MTGDSPANGIPLCLDCHANVEHYNAKHPRGNKFTPRSCENTVISGS
jgi:hypothetical protein